MKTNKSCILSQSILFLLLQGSDINCKQDQFDKHNFAISIQDFFCIKRILLFIFRLFYRGQKSSSRIFSVEDNLTIK